VSDDRGHRHRSGGGTRWLTLLGWGAAVLLAANLVWLQLSSGDGRSPAPVSRAMLLAAAFWLPVVAGAVACALGLWWAVLAHMRREKSSLVWLRNAFTGGLVGLAVLTVAGQRFPREWLAVAAVAVLAAVTGVFAYATFREYRRTAGHGGGRHGSHGDDE
jgi:hypothetical protein